MDSELDASIIIPTYNRVELLEFTLLSLYEQSIPARNFEVIVVNDGSSDQTAQIVSKMKSPYRLLALHNNVNRGAAFSRNRGIKASQGKIIILLDEMLVGRSFVEKHLSYHSIKNMVVSTHFNGQSIYTHYYPDFSLRQKRKCKITYRKAGRTCYPVYKKGVLRLFSRKDVRRHGALHYGSQNRVRPGWLHSLQAAYGKYLERSVTPWLLFITNGVSVSRKLLEEAGLFDEKQKTWMEDWELGYRLHKAGATFCNAEDISCYHQSHPVGRSLKNRLESYLSFIQKHRVIEVALVPAISPAIFNWSVEELGKIAAQYNELHICKGDLYQDFIHAFEELAETLGRHVDRLANNAALPLFKTAEAGFFRWKPDFAGIVMKQLQQLEQDSFYTGNYRELIKGFKDLLRLPS